MCALPKGFNVMSEKKSITLKKNTTILKFDERLDHENGDGYLSAARLYTSPDESGKTHSEGKKPEGKSLTKSEVTATTTTDAAIKL